MTTIDSSDMRKLEEALRLITDVRENLRDYGAALPEDGGWTDPRMREKAAQRKEQDLAVIAVNKVLAVIREATPVVMAVWERLGEPQAPARTLVTWEDSRYTGWRGSAGGTEMFIISWRTARDDPAWSMTSMFPGIYGHWKSDDPERLKAIAEEKLAAWLARVNGDAGAR